MNPLSQPPIAPPPQMPWPPGPGAGGQGKMSGMAIASLVLGILSACTGVLTGIAGLIVGLLALRSTGRSGGLVRGRGVAIAGVTLSACGIALNCIALSLFLPALNKVRHAAQSAHAQLHLSMIAQAQHTYAVANGGRLPPADDWVAAVMAPGMLAPTVPGGASPPTDSDCQAFAMNRHMSSAKVDSITDPAWTVLLFECEKGTPQAGDMADMPLAPEAGTAGYLVAFVDGHVETVPMYKLKQVIWKPEPPDAAKSAPAAAKPAKPRR